MSTIAQAPLTIDSWVSPIKFAQTLSETDKVVRGLRDELDALLVQKLSQPADWHQQDQSLEWHIAAKAHLIELATGVNPLIHW